MGKCSIFILLNSKLCFYKIMKEKYNNDKYKSYPIFESKTMLKKFKTKKNFTKIITSTKLTQRVSQKVEELMIKAFSKRCKLEAKKRNPNDLDNVYISIDY